MKRNKEKIYKVYDKIIDWFDSHRTKDLRMEKVYLDFIQAHISMNSNIYLSLIIFRFLCCVQYMKFHLQQC